MVVAPKTLPRETPNLSPCVCLEPKKKPSPFSFSLVPHSALLYLSFLIQKARTHTSFYILTCRLTVSFSYRNRRLAFRALQDKKSPSLALLLCGLAPLGAVTLDCTHIYYTSLKILVSNKEIQENRIFICS